MLKFFSTASVILMTAAFSFSQTKSGDQIAKQSKALRADKTFELVYDKRSNNTKIIGFSEDFGKEDKRRYNLQSFRFGLALNFQGSALATAPDVYLLTFQAGTKKARFKDSRRLTFTIDNTVLDLGEARYGNKNEGVEYLNFVLNRAQLSKIAAGRDVKIKIGDADFTLKPEQIKMFTNLLALSDPTSL